VCPCLIKVLIKKKFSLTQRSQSLYATASAANTQSSQVWPASANGLQAPVTEACWLLTAQRQFTFEIIYIKL